MPPSRIAVERLNPEAIRQWSRQEQEALGQQVARFAYEMHRALPVAEVWTLREQLKLDELDDETWDLYLEKMLMERVFRTPMQDVLAKRYFALWW
jgi:hypothetical protein